MMKYDNGTNVSRTHIWRSVLLLRQTRRPFGNHFKWAPQIDHPLWNALRLRPFCFNCLQVWHDTDTCTDGPQQCAKNTVILVAGLLLWLVVLVVVWRPVGFFIFCHVTCHLLDLYLTGYAHYCELGQWVAGNNIVPLCTEAQHFSWAQGAGRRLRELKQPHQAKWLSFLVHLSKTAPHLNSSRQLITAFTWTTGK